MDPYGMALKGDCRGFLDYFADWHAKELLDCRTINGDSAIHIAAVMEDPQMIKEFLERLPPETGLGVLKQKDAFGNIDLHEAVIVQNFDVARVLVEFSIKFGDAYKDLLEAKNLSGETPVYWAAALGKTKVLQILTEQVRDLRYHFRRYDGKVVLHMAVLGQHFDNGLHEAAVVENFDMDRVLVDFSRKSGDAYKNLLEAENRLGETPVCRAGALGKTKVLQIFTEQVFDLRHHFHRNDNTTIVLHMAVLGQHFDTPIWLLKHDSSLANKLTFKGSDGLTCLQLLALMPSAFKSYSKTAKTWTSPLYSCS